MLKVSPNDREAVLNHIKAKVNGGHEFELISYKDEGKRITVVMIDADEEKQTIWVNRRKDGFRIVAV